MSPHRVPETVADGCPFCAIVAGQAPAEVVHEWRSEIAIVPLNPVTKGHVIVLPKQHVRDALADPEVTARVMKSAAELAHRPANIITSAGGAATQTVWHLHVHIVPRRSGDGLMLPWTDRGAEIKDKLDHAIRRLATGLDIDPQELLGMGDSNHWSAWQIDENGIKLFIQPVMTRICAALTQAYLVPALKLLGKDPDTHTLWFDPSPLTVRPNRFEDALQLYNLGELSAKELRASGNFSEDDALGKAELASWRAWKLIMADPQLLSNAALAELAGLPVVEAQPPPGQMALPPGQEGSVPQDGARALPAQPTQSQEDGAEFATKLLPGAEQVVLRALELAGGRMLDRHTRGKLGEVERFALHTRIKDIGPERAATLLSGAFTHVPVLAVHHGVNAGELTALLHQYCVELITRNYPHSTELLRTMLRRAHG
jgi:histidine triad (HIT) family protein